MNLSFSTAEDAVKVVKSNDRVFVHGSAATPSTLLLALAQRHQELKNVEIVSITTLGDMPLTEPPYQDSFYINSLFVSANVRNAVNSSQGGYVPIFLSEIGILFRRNILPIDVAIVNVSPPDTHGYCTLGTSVDVAKPAVDTAKVVIAQINPHMPRTHGDGMIHISQFDHVVESNDPLPEVDYSSKIGANELKIGNHIAALIEDGSTLQMGIGAIPDAVLDALHHHKDLGVHTEMFSNGIMGLMDKIGRAHV